MNLYHFNCKESIFVNLFSPKFYLFDYRHKGSQVHGAPVTDIVKFSVQAQEITKAICF